MKKHLKLNKFSLIYSLVCAVIFIGICSKSSPIYPFNDWVDANCFMTVGKSMLHGLVPYKDLMEQKGTLLYIIHAVSALVSDTSFIGVFFFEILFATLFLFICNKILDLYNSEKQNYLWLPIIALAVYSSRAFCHGDSAEEICLPIVAYALYVGLKAIKNDALPDKKESFFIGVTSACMLWIKFSMLGVYIGWFLYFLVTAIKKKQFSEFWVRILYILFGVILMSAPIILYHILTGSLKDMIEAYFYNNLFRYLRLNTAKTGFASVILNVCKGGFEAFLELLFVFILMIIGAIPLVRSKNHKVLSFSWVTGICLFFSVYSGGRTFPYYALIIGAFTPIGIIGINHYLNVKISTASLVITPIVCFMLAYTISNNTYLLSFEKSDMPQYKFAEIINEKENPTLLNYGFIDSGFYLAADIVPSCKYFCKIAVNIPELMETQNEFVEEGKVDFVITYGKPIHFKNYQFIDMAEFYFEGGYRSYYLYEKYE